MEETAGGQKSLLTLIEAFAAAIFCGGFYWIISEDPNSDHSAARQLALERQLWGLTQSLEEETGAKALTGRVAAAREKDVAAPTLDATRRHKDAGRAFKTRGMAHAGQMESNQSVDDRKRGMPLDLKTLTSVGKPNAEATALDASAPDRRLNPSIEGSNATSEAGGSVKPPQDNVTAATQTPSEATPDGPTGRVSRRLVGPNQSLRDPLQLPRAIPPADEAKLITRAESLIKQSDIVGARLLLEYALAKGSARAAFMMAETYDWKMLRSLRTSGVRGDAQMARELYHLAAAAGIEKARERLEALQSEVTADMHAEGGSTK